ncbi:MAG: holo-ACP synthase [Tumebacillaceae bacterium]
MIAGIGIDITEIDRIAQLFERQGEALWERILAPEERKEFNTQKRRVEFLAGRFAAKEAASKALGTGLGKVGLHHIIVTNGENGAPQIRLDGHAAEVAETKRIKRMHLSISHSDHYAVAQVVAETDE